MNSIELRFGPYLRYMTWLCLILFSGLALASLREHIALPLLFAGFAALGGYGVYATNAKLVVDERAITLVMPFRRSRSIAWDDLDRLIDSPSLQVVTLYGKSGTRMQIPNMLPGFELLLPRLLDRVRRNTEPSLDERRALKVEPLRLPKTYYASPLAGAFCLMTVALGCVGIQLILSREVIGLILLVPLYFPLFFPWAVTIDEDRLSFHRLFGRRRVLFDDISSLDVVTEGTRYQGVEHRHVFLDIHLHSGKKARVAALWGGILPFRSLLEQAVKNHLATKRV